MYLVPGSARAVKAEIHVSYIAERYGLLLEMYLGHCGCAREERTLLHSRAYNAAYNSPFK